MVIQSIQFNSLKYRMVSYDLLLRIFEADCISILEFYGVDNYMDEVFEYLWHCSQN
jgi:hypothetical protein